MNDTPRYMLCAPIPYAMLTATLNNTGRNWRRIKREQNKAVAAVMKARRKSTG